MGILWNEKQFRKFWEEDEGKIDKICSAVPFEDDGETELSFQENKKTLKAWISAYPIDWWLNIFRVYKGVEIQEEIDQIQRKIKKLEKKKKRLIEEQKSWQKSK